MRDMRNFKRKMTDEEAYRLIQNGEYGILSTYDDGGQPYGTPLNYAVSGESIYFHSAVEGQKLDNIKHNNRVCFTIVGNTKILPDKFSTAYESIMVFGRAYIVDECERAKALRLLIEKYCPEYLKDGDEYIKSALDKTEVVRINIEKITGKHRIE